MMQQHKIITPTTDDASIPKQMFTLAADTELRIDVDASETVVVGLESGKVEIFGREITRDEPVEISNTSVAIYAVVDSVISLKGQVQSSYVGYETKMVTYQNVGHLLHLQRIRAMQEKKVGPKVLITGSQGSGKSTLSKIFTNYAVKLGWAPVLVDLDVGENLISPPGHLSAAIADMPLPNNYLSEKSLCFFYGDLQVSNQDFYLKQAKELATAVNMKLQSDLDLFKKQFLLDDPTIPSELKHIVSPSELRLYGAGAIISTMTMESRNVDVIGALIEYFQVDYVFVLDFERLLNELKAKYGKIVQIIKLDKSGGVYAYPPTHKRRLALQQFTHYFSGIKSSYSSFQLPLSLTSCKIFKIDVQRLPFSALPVGTQEEFVDMSANLVSVKEENIQGKIMACLYVDKKQMKELEEKIAAGNREALATQGKIIMAASTASLMQIKRISLDTNSMEVMTIYQKEDEIPSEYFLLSNIQAE